MGIYEDALKKAGKLPSGTPKNTNFSNDVSIYELALKKAREKSVENNNVFEQKKNNVSLEDKKNLVEKTFDLGKSLFNKVKTFLFGDNEKINVSEEVFNDVKKSKEDLQKQREYLINMLKVGDKKEIYKRLEDLEETENIYNQILAKKDDEKGFLNKIFNIISGKNFIDIKNKVLEKLPEDEKKEYLKNVEKELFSFGGWNKEFKEKVIPFYKAITDTLNLRNYKEIKDTLIKYSKGEELNNKEKETILNLRANSLKTMYLNNDLGELVADTVSDMPRYMVEYGLLSGAVAPVILSKIPVTNNLMASKLSQGVVGSIIKGIVGGSLNVPYIGQKLQDYIIPDFYELQEKKGINVKEAVNLLDKKSDFNKALKKSYLNNVIEYAAEGLGAIVEKPIEFIKTAILSKFIKNNALSPNIINKVLQKIGWNGVIGEVFEEEITELAQSKVEEKKYRNPFTTPEGRQRLLVETLGIGIFNGIANISDSVLNKVLERKNKENWDKIEFNVDDKKAEEVVNNMPDVIKQELEKISFNKNIVNFENEINKAEALGGFSNKESFVENIDFLNKSFKTNFSGDKIIKIINNGENLINELDVKNVSLNEFVNRFNDIKKEVEKYFIDEVNNKDLDDLEKVKVIKKIKEDIDIYLEKKIGEKYNDFKNNIKEEIEKRKLPEENNDEIFNLVFDYIKKNPDKKVKDVFEILDKEGKIEQKIQEIDKNEKKNEKKGKYKRGDIKKLEEELNNLIGYSPSGENWKMEYHIRNAYIEEALTNAPNYIKKRIKKILDELDDIRYHRRYEKIKENESKFYDKQRDNRGSDIYNNTEEKIDYKLDGEGKKIKNKDLDKLSLKELKKRLEIAIAENEKKENVSKIIKRIRARSNIISYFGLANIEKIDKIINDEIEFSGESVGKIKRIEMPELVSLVKNLIGEYPKILKKIRGKKEILTLGRFYFDKEIMKGNISLLADIFKNENLASRVFAHEIGHLVDWLPEKNISRGNLLGRILVLRNFLKNTFGKLNNKKIREELINLSFQWRPLYGNETPEFIRYRKSPSELYADAISVLLNDPALLKKQAPIFFEAFFENLDKKEEVKNELFKIWERSEEGVYKEREEAIRKMFKKGNEKLKLLIAERERKKKDFMLRLKEEFDMGAILEQKISELKKRKIDLSPEENPYYAYEEFNYINSKVSSFVRTEIQPLVNEIEKEYSLDDFGEYLYLKRVINERWDKANPLGMTKTTAKNQIEYLKKTRGEKYIEDMEKFAGKFKEINDKVLDFGKEMGIYKEDIVNQLKLNKSYATFQVIDYLDSEYIPAGLKIQKGTFKEITNPFSATLVKSINILKWGYINKAKLDIINFFKNYFSDEIRPAKRKFNGKYFEIQEEKNEFEDTVKLMENGEFKGYVVDKSVAKIFDKNFNNQSLFLQGLSLINNTLFRPAFIVFNTGYQSINILRDFWRFWKAIPTLNFGTALKYYFRAVPEAFKRGFDLGSKLEVEMMEKGVLGVSYVDIKSGESLEDVLLEKNLAKIGIFEEKNKFRFLDILKFPFTIIKNFGSTIESIPKMAGYLYLKEKNGLSEKEIGHIVRNMFGSPDFLKKGKGYYFYNNVFLFSQAMVNALKSDYEMAFTNQKTRSGFWVKTITLNIVPKILMLMAMAGLWGDELKRMFEKIGEYDKTNYNIIPLGENEEGKIVYLRIPQDETGRMIGALFYKTFKKENLWDIPKENLKYVGELIPSLNPIVDIGINTSLFLAGKNPYDFFYGKNILTDDEYKAGGKYALIPFLKWVFVKSGGRIIARVDLAEKGEKDWYNKTLMVPIIGDVLGRWLKITSRGENELLEKEKEKIDKEKAKERIDLKNEIKNIVNSKNGNKINMLRDVILKYTKDLPKNERKKKANYIIKKYRYYELYNKSNEYIDEFLNAENNAAKSIILYEMYKRSKNEDFLEDLKFLKSQKVLSDDVIKGLKNLIKNK